MKGWVPLRSIWLFYVAGPGGGLALVDFPCLTSILRVSAGHEAKEGEETGGQSEMKHTRVANRRAQKKKSQKTNGWLRTFLPFLFEKEKEMSQNILKKKNNMTSFLPLQETAG